MTDKFGRNERCHCGSGKKFKRCHGVPGEPAALPKEIREPTTLRHRMLSVALDHVDAISTAECYRVHADPVAVLLSPQEIPLYRPVIEAGTRWSEAPSTEPPIVWLVVERSWLVSFLLIKDGCGVPRSPETAALLRKGSVASSLPVVALAEGHTSMAILQRRQTSTAAERCWNDAIRAGYDFGDGFCLHFVDLNAPGAKELIRNLKKSRGGES